MLSASRGLTQSQSFPSLIHTEIISSEKTTENLYLWPQQWHQNRFKPFPICLQSGCNAIITCFHGPRSHLDRIKKITQGAHFLPSLCVCVLFSAFGSYFYNRLQQQIRIWGAQRKHLFLPALGFRIQSPHPVGLRVLQTQEYRLTLNSIVKWTFNNHAIVTQGSMPPDKDKQRGRLFRSNVTCHVDKPRCLQMFLQNETGGFHTAQGCYTSKPSC